MKFYKILIILLYNYPKINTVKPIVVPQKFFLKVKKWLIVGSPSPIFPYFSMKFFLKKEGGTRFMRDYDNGFYGILYEK